MISQLHSHPLTVTLVNAMKNPDSYSCPSSFSNTPWRLVLIMASITVLITIMRIVRQCHIRSDAEGTIGLGAGYKETVLAVGNFGTIEKKLKFILLFAVTA